MERQLLLTDVSGQTRSHLPGSSGKPLKMGLTGCPKMSVTYYKSVPCNIPVEKRAHLHGSWSLNSHMYLSLIHNSPLFSESFLLVIGYKIMKIMHVSSYGYYCNVKLKIWCNTNQSLPWTQLRVFWQWAGREQLDTGENCEQGRFILCTLPQILFG